MKTCKTCGIEMQEITSVGFDGAITYYVMCPHCKKMIPAKQFKSIASAMNDDHSTVEGKSSRSKRNKKKRRK